MAIESSTTNNNESIEEAEQQSQEEGNTDSSSSNQSQRRPYYTYSTLELCSEISDDVKSLQDKAHSAKNLWDMALLWYEMEHKPILQLLDLKLGLLGLFLEEGK